ncbi:MAG TPA: hypothetical protein VNJ53_11240 [Gaiellaceae bacterium]|nr:hypothetical protein [Gaiellaceae bacterium]
MPRPRLRLVGLVLAGAAGAAELLVAHVPGPGPDAARAAFQATPAGRTTALVPARLARAAIAWRGGPITTTSGEVVTVRVSDTLPVESTTPEAWAEFLSRLTHGSELALLSAYLAPLDEVQDICGQDAIGCYAPNRMVSIAETLPDGTTAEDVVRHEYGHHVAFHRLNAPWRAIDWGPKRWASAAGVCGRVQRREAFPGNQGGSYAQNPGEAWAEVYRLMDERKAGLTTGRWPIIAPSFYPDEAALSAAERDVLEPWTAGAVSSFQRVFARAERRAWTIRLATPLDGDLRVTVSLPRGAEHEVALLSGDRRTVLRRAQWIGQRAKRATATVCGQRTLFLRIAPRGAAGRVAVTVTTP